MADANGNKANNADTVRMAMEAEIMEQKKGQPFTEAAGTEEADPDDGNISYYVIEDLSTWKDGSLEKSRLERFESLPEAVARFTECRQKEAGDKPDAARATFGLCVNGSEFDLIHVRNHENCLSLDFTHSREAVKSGRFMDDLQVLYCAVGFEKVRVHREMSPKEIKDFVRRRFEHQLRSNGFDDISCYMDRFDELYQKGRIAHLMPTASQKHIVEDVPFMEWENPYIGIHYKYADIVDKELSVAEYQSLLGIEQSGISVSSLRNLQKAKGDLWEFALDKKEHCLQENIPVVTVRDGREARYFEIPEELVMQVRNSEFRGFVPETELAFRLADRYISIQEVSGGYDYTVYDMDFRELDGGVYDNPDITIREALDEIVMDLKQPAQRSGLEGSICDDDELIPVDYGRLKEKAEQAAKIMF